MTNQFGMTLDYELIYDKNNRKITLNQKISKPFKVVDVQYQGLMINTDFNFKRTNEVLYPPYSIRARKGEKIKLAYRAGKYENIEEYLVLSMLDWKQIKMDEKPYLLLNIDSTKMGYGTFYITAPKKPGLYEFVAFIIPNPISIANSLSIIDTAYRFTIEVK